MPRVPAVLLAGVVSATPLVAQTDTVAATPPPAAPHRWHLARGVAVPVIRDVSGAALTSIGIAATAAVRAYRLAPDLALVVTPQALLVGAFLTHARANVAIPIPVGRSSRLIPSAGLSLVGVAGLGAIGGVQGVNTTVAYHAFARTDGDSTARLGLRVALGRHQFIGSNARDGGGFWLFDVGVVRR